MKTRRRFFKLKENCRLEQGLGLKVTDCHGRSLASEGGSRNKERKRIERGKKEIENKKERRKTKEKEERERCDFLSGSAIERGRRRKDKEKKRRK